MAKVGSCFRAEPLFWDQSQAEETQALTRVCTDGTWHTPLPFNRQVISALQAEEHVRVTSCEVQK